MKNTLLLVMAVALCMLVEPGFAAEQASAKADLQTLVGKIQTKLRAGQKTEKELDEDIKQFDALLAKYKDEKTDDVAQILFMKATLYVEIFDNIEKGEQLLKQLKKDFPNTRQAQRVDEFIAATKKEEAAKAIQRSLSLGAKFPDFEEKDTTGKPLSLAGLKGKVVLVDFWASWCGPCVNEMPNVIKAYEKYHLQGFEIVGISLDRDEAAFAGFIKKHKMTWPQFFDGQGWGNKLAVKYGVNSIPKTYLIDQEGKIIAADLRGTALEETVAKAVAKR